MNIENDAINVNLSLINITNARLTPINLAHGDDEPLRIAHKSSL